MTTRLEIVAAAESLLGARYAHQGRSMEIGFDCAGTLIEVGHKTAVTAFEFLGYSSEPDGETFERLLDENLERLPEIYDARLADVLAFDFGKGIQHCAIVVSVIEHRFDWRRFTVVHALRPRASNRPDGYGVVRGPLMPVYSKALKVAYQIPGIID